MPRLTPDSLQHQTEELEDAIRRACDLGFSVGIKETRDRDPGRYLSITHEDTNLEFLQLPCLAS